MKYVFFGSPRFAEIILERLILATMPPIALVANPDRPVGRKHVITPPLTKSLALNASAITGQSVSIKVLQPETLDADCIKTLRACAPDFFVVAAYSKIIPQAVLDIPRLGTLGVHPSLLPKYRGASPIQSAILAGETLTGTTIYKMDAGMDSGPIIASDTWPIAANEQYPQLEEELALVSAHLLLKTIPEFFMESITPEPQNNFKATFTKKFVAHDGFVDEQDLAAAESGDATKSETILRTINALTPEPGCWTLRNGKRVKLLAGEIKNGALKLTRIQEEGQTPKKV